MTPAEAKPSVRFQGTGMRPGRPDILKLVGDLHDGIADEHLWARGIGAICDQLAIPGMLMGSVGGDGQAVHFEFAHNIGQDLISLIEGPLNDPDHNPWISLAREHPLRQLATIDDVGGQEAFEQSRMWKEIYVPFGMRDTLGSPLERQPEYSQVLIAGRGSRQPDFDAEDRRTLATMLPHIARAWRVKRKLAEWEELTGTLKFVLDRLDRAIVVTGPEGEVRFANQAADRLLSRGDGIDVTAGRIRAANSRDTDALRTLVGTATRTGVGAGLVAVDAMAVECEDEARLAIIAEPLAPSHSDRIGHDASAGAVLFISRSEASTRPSVERLKIVYGFTPAEARLTSLVVDGHDIASAGEAAGVSRNTVKYHLKAIFEKVGVTRQAQLVRRVLADVGGLAEPDGMTLKSAA